MSQFPFSIPSFGSLVPAGQSQQTLTSGSVPQFQGSPQNSSVTLGPAMPSLSQQTSSAAFASASSTPLHQRQMATSSPAELPLPLIEQSLRHSIQEINQWLSNSIAPEQEAPRILANQALERLQRALDACQKASQAISTADALVQAWKTSLSVQPWQSQRVPVSLQSASSSLASRRINASLASLPLSPVEARPVSPSFPSFSSSSEGPSDSSHAAASFSPLHHPAPAFDDDDDEPSTKRQRVEAPVTPKELGLGDPFSLPLHSSSSSSSSSSRPTAPQGNAYLHPVIEKKEEMDNIFEDLNWIYEGCRRFAVSPKFNLCLRGRNAESVHGFVEKMRGEWELFSNRWKDHTLSMENKLSLIHDITEKIFSTYERVKAKINSLPSQRSTICQSLEPKLKEWRSNHSRTDSLAEELASLSERKQS